MRIELKGVLAQLMAIALLMGSMAIHAQQSLQFSRYDIDDGLGNMTCTPLGMDSVGYLWLGVQPLMRFDGYTFKTFPTDPGDPDNNHVMANRMADDGKGHRLFAGTSGLFWYNEASDLMEPILDNGNRIFSSSVLEYSSNSAFWCIENDQLLSIKMPEKKIEHFTIPIDQDNKFHLCKYSSTGKIWLVFEHTLLSFDTQRKEFGQPISLPSIASHHARIFTITSGGFYLILDESVLRIDEQRNSFAFVFHFKQKFGEGNIREHTTICSHDGNHVWVQGMDKSVFRIETTSGELREYDYSDLKTPSYAPLTDIKLFELKDGSIVINSPVIGLALLDPSSGEIEHFAADDNNPGALPTEALFGIQTSENVFWIGAKRVGLIKAEISRKIIPTFKQESISDRGVVEPNVRCIEEFDSRYLFYSTFEEVSLFDRNNHTFSPLPSPEDGTPFKLISSIRTMLKDKHGNLILLGWNKELVYLDYKNKRTLDFAGFAFGSKRLHGSNTVFLDSKENLWIGGGSGMFVLNTRNFAEPEFGLSNLEIVKHSGSNDFPQVTTSTGIAEDKAGKIWIGRMDGLYLYDYTSDTYSKKLLDKKNPVLGVVAILRSENNTMWIGTNGGGLRKWDDAIESFITYSIKDGLPDNVIYSIEEDEQGNLWMGTNKGLCCFNPNTLQCKIFTEKDGIQNYEYNGNSAGKTWDGWLAFGGITGFNFFHPDSVNRSATAPRIVFTEFRVQGESRPYMNGEIRLAHNENNFSFEFAALDFFRNQENQYAYKMDGIDESWVMCGNRRFVSYPDLNPGTYTLHVKACNSYGVWNEVGISKTIIIATPFWATLWFRVLALLVFLSGVYVLYRYRLAQQTKLLTVRNTIASDLHDEIGSTLSSISLSSAVIQKKIKDTNPEVKTLLNQIGVNTDNMMEAMSDIVWTINAKNDRFENVVNRMRAFAIEIMEPLDCTVHFDVNENMLDVKLGMKQRKNLYLIFKEAVHNAAKYSGCKNLWVNFSQRNSGAIILQLRDDGKGFSTSHAENGHVSMGGNGLYNMNKRAAEINGTLTIQSNPGEGTKVELVINP